MEIQQLDIQSLLISNEELILRSESCRALSNSWRSDIADIISELPEWKEYSNSPCTYDKTQHLSKAATKNQRLRRIYMNATQIYINKHLKERNAQQKVSHD
jgi:hypothetical protein